MHVCIYFYRLLHRAASRVSTSTNDISMKSFYAKKTSFEKARIEERLKAYQDRPMLSNRITNIDLVPTMDSDSLIDVFNGHVNYEPFGVSTFLLNTMNRFILFGIVELYTLYIYIYIYI